MAATLEELMKLRRVRRRCEDPKRRAHYQVRSAIARGELGREDCLFCDDPKTHGHHHDYSKPLAVTWLCPKHHGLAHRTYVHHP